MGKILKPDFFRQKTLHVAKELLGTQLVRKYRGKESRYMITETEAYVGPHDKACHAHKGRTKRTEVMFGHAGHWYVYLCYGMYDMLNIVTEERDYPAAVLVRGVEGISGPGRLTRALHITRTLDGCMANTNSGLWIEEREIKIPQRAISRTPRIGINYAEEWKDKPYRFVLTLP